jgi:curved DNA-binding protein CbpA
LRQDPTNVAASTGILACSKEIEKQQKEQEQFEEEQEQKQREDELTKGQPTSSTNDDAVAGEGEEDDLLNDFFDEVEEVVTKRKEEIQQHVSEAAAATNAIRNDRRTLGTVEAQIDRLLQTNYEWKNLNPFYVLQLPHTASEDDISKRYKALSLLLHPDKNHTKFTSEEGRQRVQLAYDQVQSAKEQLLRDVDRKRYIVSLVEEGIKQGEHKWVQLQKQQKKYKNRKNNSTSDDHDDADSSLETVQEKEIMRVFAQVEYKRREVEERQRKYEQREQQQEDSVKERERHERQFDKSWRQTERVDKRVGNWRDFATHGKRQKK